MKVRLLIGRSGPSGAFSAGDEIEVSETEGYRLVEAGKATPIASQPKSQKRRKATTEPNEKRGK